MHRSASMDPRDFQTALLPPRNVPVRGGAHPKRRPLGDDERVPGLMWWLAGGTGKPATGAQLRSMKRRREEREERERAARAAKGDGVIGSIGHALFGGKPPKAAAAGVAAGAAAGEAAGAGSAGHRSNASRATSGHASSSSASSAGRTTTAGGRTTTAGSHSSTSRGRSTTRGGATTTGNVARRGSSPPRLRCPGRDAIENPRGRIPVEIAPHRSPASSCSIASTASTEIFQRARDAIDFGALEAAAHRARRTHPRDSTSANRDKAGRLSCSVQGPPMKDFYNLVYLSDGVNWVARIPGHRRTAGRLKAQRMQADIPAALFLRSRTSLPVPHVFGSEARPPR
ncbi:MAG: hypothetical protein M1826_003926 [Phylliscum demangeonii]|nr:MAG: hypothetical protein M1826_003926 [Phylliscum demangeonii]